MCNQRALHIYMYEWMNLWWYGMVHIGDAQ